MNKSTLWTIVGVIVAVLIAWFIVNILQAMFWVMLPWGLASLLSMLIWIAFLGAVVFLMVKAYQGERFKLPIIGDLAEKQA